MRLVKVTWIDSGIHLDEGWAPVEQYVARGREHGSTAVTVGMLVDDSDNWVTIGLSVDMGNDNIFGAQMIYRPNIVAIDDLHPVHPAPVDRPWLPEAQP